jgi:leucyl/phenylalanyl-tRNA---protein transferase
MDVQFVTGGVTADMIERNYPLGLFPMSNPGSEAITWHRPPRRAVIPLDRFHVPRSLGRTLRQARFTVTVNRDFEAVMRACARQTDREATWIDDRILAAYAESHRRGQAHSVEIWTEGGALAGGVYGVQLGGAFFAESKFHTARDMSKVALAHLVFRLRERGFALLEVQYVTAHLEQFGAVEISSRVYRRQLAEALLLSRTFA